MMETLSITQGDSVTIAVELPADRMSQVEDIVVYLGNKLVGKKSDNTLFATTTENIFHAKLSSRLTQNLTGQHNFVVAIDYADLGVIKVSVEDSLLVTIKCNNNQFSNASVSEAVSATVTITIVDNELTQDVTIATISRGYSALEYYRIEKNLPNATFEDMMLFYMEPHPGTATYNSIGQLSRIDYENGRYKSFTYNTSGKLTEVNINGQFKKEIAYDEQGRWASTSKAVIS